MRTTTAALLRSFDDGRPRAEFYRMWRLGVRAGLTHPAILRTLGPFRGTTGAIHAHFLEGTTAGRDLAALVRERRHLFEAFEAALLTMAEESGRLEAVLGALAEFHERQYRMMLAVQKHLAYPAFVSLAAVWLLPLPMVFRGQGGAYVVAVVVGMIAWLMLGGALLAGRAQRFQRRPAFVRARLARTLATALEAGLPLARALRLAAEASGEPALARHLARFDEHTLSTQSLERTLAGAPAITPDLLGAVRVAEGTGDLSTTLGRMAVLYEDGFR